MQRGFRWSLGAALVASLALNACDCGGGTTVEPDAATVRRDTGVTPFDAGSTDAIVADRQTGSDVVAVDHGANFDATQEDAQIQTDAGLPACTDDALEENDDASQATQMVPGVLSAQICPGDEDWFAINVNANQEITALLSFSHAEGDLDMGLYDSQGNELDSSASSSDDEEVTAIAASADTYYIVVIGYDGAMAGYDLDVSLAAVTETDGGVSACADDAMEDNDTFASASPITVGDHQAQLCPGDPDFFVINLNVGDVLSADLAIDSVSANLDLLVMSPDGTELGASTSLTQSEHVEITATSAGAHVLRVYGAAADDSSMYTLSVAVQSVTPTCQDDGFEDNDDSAHAVSLAPGSHAGKVCAGDEDWFAVTLQAGDQLVANLQFDNAAGDLNMQLIGPSAQVLASAESVDDNELIQHQAVNGGIYQLRVFGPNNAENSYSLGLQVTTQMVCANDAFEPNDSAVQATALGTGSYPAKLCTGDEDWYRLTLNNGDTLAVALTFSNGDGNVDLKILGEDAQTLLASSLSDTDNEAATYVATASGDVLVQVLGRAGVENSYGMELSVTPGIVTCQDDGFEDNDTQASAVDLQPGQYTAAICPGDEDWYHLALNAGDQLVVDLTYSFAQGDINAALINAAGQTVVAGVSADDDEHLVATIAAAGDFFLVISGAADVANGYDLDIVATPAQTCRDDSFENNDTAATAVSLVAGDYDATICSGDDDFFAVDLNAGDTVDATIDFAVATGDLDLSLLSPTGSVAISSTTASSGTESVHYVVPTAGRYALRVYGFMGAAADYSLTLDIIPVVPVCRDDAFEDNDAQASAALVEAGTLDGQICASDDDWFAIALNAHDVLDINLLFTHADGDLDLALFEPDGTIAQGAYSVNDNESITDYEAPAAGLYAVRVRGFSGATNAYQLVLGLTPYVAPCPEDNLEENDTVGTATPYAGAPVSAQICADDSDFFSLALNAGDSLAANLSFTHADGDLDMVLRNPAGSIVASALSVTDNETIPAYVAPSAGLYSLEVYGMSGVANAYGLQMTVTPFVPVCTDDENEENDTQLSATAYMGSDFTGQICAGDDDWYKVDLNAGDSLRAELLFSQSVGDLDLRLYDVTGQLLDSSGSVTDNELITFTAASAGSYFLKVEGYDQAESPYTLGITLTVVTPSCVDDSYEPNDSAETAAALSGDIDDGQICSGDDDYYAVSLSAGETFVADLLFDHADGDLDMRLINPAGAIVASSTTATDNEGISYAARLAGTFILRVYGFNGAENSYMLGSSINAELSCPGDDALEDNDDFAGAATALPGSVVGILCTADDDYYKVQVPEGGLLRAQLSFDGNVADLDLYMYDASEAPVDSSLSVSSRETVAGYSDSATTFYVRVHGFQDQEQGSYALSLSVEQSPFYSAGSPKGCPADDGMNNPDYLSAIQLRNGDSVDGVTCGANMDWYAVSLEAGEQIEAELGFAQAAGDLGLALLDPARDLVVDADSGTDNETLRYTVPQDQPGTYFLAVYGVDDAENWYSLRVGVSGALAQCVDDGFEVNNSNATATALVPGQSIGAQRCAGDPDYYKIVVGAGQSMAITMFLEHGDNCDLDLDLYDANDDWVDGSYNTDDRELIALTAESLNAEYTYYLLVDSSWDAHRCPYTLDLQVEGP